MKKLALLCPLLMLLASCGQREVAPERAGACSVYGLEVEPANEQLTVRFKSDCSDLISGYNIYIEPQPLALRSSSTAWADATPHNRTPFPGDTDPTDEYETYVADGLENGENYYVSVAVVYGDRSLSEPTEEVEAACGPRGEMEIGVRYTAEKDGYSFINEQYVEADELGNDLYFYSQEGTDYLASPTRLDGFLRKTRLAKLPVNGDIDSAAEYYNANDVQPDAERIAISEGDWLVLKTPESHLVLLQVLKLRGSSDDRSVRLFYAYSSIPNQLLL